jgi:hypothetical protein
MIGFIYGMQIKATFGKMYRGKAPQMSQKVTFRVNNNKHHTIASF